MVNICPQFSFKYPTSHSKQKEIVSHFEQKNSIGFDNCPRFIDGLLIRTSRPIRRALAEAGLSVLNIFYGRKKLFGLNTQAICDHKRRFLDINIAHPASISD